MRYTVVLDHAKPAGALMCLIFLGALLWVTLVRKRSNLSVKRSSFISRDLEEEGVSMPEPSSEGEVEMGAA